MKLPDTNNSKAFSTNLAMSIDWQMNQGFWNTAW